jgi:hypothetical protein
MKAALLLLILLTAACSPAVQYVPVTAECAVPVKPVYVTLDRSESISSPANLESLMLIISDMSAYIARLESTVDCFNRRKQ